MSRIGVSGLSVLIFPKPCDSVVAAVVLVCARADDLGDEHAGAEDERDGGGDADHPR